MNALFIPTVALRRRLLLFAPVASRFFAGHFPSTQGERSPPRSRPLPETMRPIPTMALSILPLAPMLPLWVWSTGGWLSLLRRGSLLDPKQDGVAGAGFSGVTQLVIEIHLVDPTAPEQCDRLARDLRPEPLPQLRGVTPTEPADRIQPLPRVAFVVNPKIQGSGRLFRAPRGPDPHDLNQPGQPGSGRELGHRVRQRPGARTGATRPSGRGSAWSNRTAPRKAERRRRPAQHRRDPSRTRRGFPCLRHRSGHRASP